MANHPRPEGVAGGEDVQHNGNDPKYRRSAAPVNRLSPGDCLTALEWQVLGDAFAERAAIAEFDGGLAREAAERLAANEILDLLNAGVAP